MKSIVQQLIDWSEWGHQWVEYLQRKPLPTEAAKKELDKFSRVFQEIGRKAASVQEKSIPENELKRLAAKAEEIQRHFHNYLRLIQDRQADRRDQPPPAARESQPVAVKRPVPIGEHKLPPLPYAYDALEPYIDAETMRIHHDRLHQNYVNNLNIAELMLAKARASNNYDLIKHWEREAAFNGAGHYLHTLFWNVMSPHGGGEPRGELADQLIRDFGSLEAFKRQFSQAAEKVEGGGWALLVWSPRAQHTEILQAEKHQNLTQWESIPLLVLDVWEHAYFLKYRNNRGQYIDAWWNVVNWPHVQDRYLQARRLRWEPY